MNKWRIGLGILSVVLSGVLFGGSSVSAASTFDGVVTTVDNLEIKSIASTETRDFGTSWAGEVIAILEKRCDAGQSAMCDWEQFMRDNLGNTASDWAVVVNSENTGFQVYAAPHKTQEFHFVDYGVDGKYLESKSGQGDIYISPTFAYHPEADEIYRTSNGLRITGSESHPLGGYDVQALGSDQYEIKVFLSTFATEYPTGYEGIIIPDTYTPPIEPLTWTPDIQHVQTVDWKIKLQDRNFNTFDPVPFTCDLGLTPVIEYDLYNEDIDPNTPIDQGTFSPTVPYEYSSEKYNVKTEYKFIGNYYCGIGENEPTFSGQTTYRFKLDAGGNFIGDQDTGDLSGIEIFEKCINEDAPFIHVSECLGAFGSIVDKLSFGRINLFSKFYYESPTDCQEIGKMGDWLGLSNKYVCPQFSADVRNTVTPFITFGLALAVVGAISTKSRWEMT